MSCFIMLRLQQNRFLEVMARMKGPKVQRDFPWDHGLLHGSENRSHTATFLVVGSGSQRYPFAVVDGGDGDFHWSGSEVMPTADDSQSASGFLGLRASDRKSKSDDEGDDSDRQRREIFATASVDDFYYWHTLPETFHVGGCQREIMEDEVIDSSFKEDEKNSGAEENNSSADEESLSASNTSVHK